MKGWLNNFGVVRLFIGHYRRLAIEFQVKLVARSGWSLEVGRGRRQFAVVAGRTSSAIIRQRGSEIPAMIEMVAMAIHSRSSPFRRRGPMSSTTQRGASQCAISCSKTRAVSIWGCSEIVHLVGRMNCCGAAYDPIRPSGVSSPPTSMLIGVCSGTTLATIGWPWCLNSCRHSQG